MVVKKSIDKRQVLKVVYIVNVNDNVSIPAKGCDSWEKTVIKKYAFYDPKGLYKKDDVIVVMKDNGALNFVKIVEVLTPQQYTTTDDCITFDMQNLSVPCGKVDTTDYQDRKKKKERRAIIIRDLEAARQRLSETAIYEILAKESPELAKLLTELKSLTV